MKRGWLRYGVAILCDLRGCSYLGLTEVVMFVRLGYVDHIYVILGRVVCGSPGLSCVFGRF